MKKRRYQATAGTTELHTEQLNYHSLKNAKKFYNSLVK